MRCPFCRDRVPDVDYKDVAALAPFLTKRNGIKPRLKKTKDGRRRRCSGLCAKHQRRLAVAVKRARLMSLLPQAPPPRALPVPERRKESR